MGGEMGAEDRQPPLSSKYLLLLLLLLYECAPGLPKSGGGVSGTAKGWFRSSLGNIPIDIDFAKS
jgi:hypothetical protein